MSRRRWWQFWKPEDSPENGKHEERLAEAEDARQDAERKLRQTVQTTEQIRHLTNRLDRFARDRFAEEYGDAFGGRRRRGAHGHG